MISKKIFLTLTIMAAALLAHTAPALATGPDCSSGRNKRGYDAGVLIGKSIVRQAWNGVDQDPNQFDTFMDIVRDAINTAISGLPNDASDYVKCRAKGLAQGACDQLGTIQAGVATTCLLDGQVWGDLSADLYCALSIEFGGQDVLGLMPSSPLNVCGANFEAGCHSHFATGVTSSLACQPYSVDPYGLVFADWQIGMCIYEAP